MISQMNQQQLSEVLNFIQSDPFQNPYLYIDVISLGLEGQQIHTWKVWDGERIAGIIYAYHNSVQLLFDDAAGVPDDLISFLQEHRFQMINGKSALIESLSTFLSEYRPTYGKIMSHFEDSGESFEIVEKANQAQMIEIASLICSEEKIGSNYQVKDLAAQLTDRLLYDGCRNYIIRENGAIVCHIATYAEASDLAILGGLVTHPEYRGNGYGRIALEALKDAVIREHKKAILYCYYQDTINWYKKLGWTEVAECGKLELIHE